MRGLSLRPAVAGATVALALLLISCGSGGDGDSESEADGQGNGASGDPMTVPQLCDSLADVAAAFDSRDWPALQQGWEEVGDRRLPDDMPPLAQQGVRIYVDIATRSDSMESYRAEVDQPSPGDAEAMTAVEDFYGTSCG
jgi:hypothetical protein